MANTTRKSREQCVTGSRTIAQVKAGSVILPAFGGSYIITGGWMRAVGADCAGATSINISDTTSTPVVGVAVAVAPLDDGAVVDFDAATNVTRTTYGVAFAWGKGLQIRDNALGSLTGPDTIDFCVKFMKVSG